ncbi:hypothetical protein LCGC14_0400330 [marine sediment metagenome]|uniref:Uncharacterized protein n=1 Tax=marine sediment metagenome TaxID=412755 RepID=A0A0F9W613_9ZZZZ
MRTIEMCVIAIMLVALSLAVCGCQEAQTLQERWGRGEPSAVFQSFFGNDNNARLNFVQMQLINKQIQDVNELAGRVRALEFENPAELAERVRKLEETAVTIYDPNEWILEAKGESPIDYDKIKWMAR